MKNRFSLSVTGAQDAPHVRKPCIQRVCMYVCLCVCEYKVSMCAYERSQMVPMWCDACESVCQHVLSTFAADLVSAIIGMDLNEGSVLLVRPGAQLLIFRRRGHSRSSKFDFRVVVVASWLLLFYGHQFIGSDGHGHHVHTWKCTVTPTKWLGEVACVLLHANHISTIAVHILGFLRGYHENLISIVR